MMFHLCKIESALLIDGACICLKGRHHNANLVACEFFWQGYLQFRYFKLGHEWRKIVDID